MLQSVEIFISSYLYASIHFESYFYQFLNRLLKISISLRRRRPTNIPTQDATGFLPTTSRQTTTDVPSAQSTSTTKIPHVLLN